MAITGELLNAVTSKTKSTITKTHIYQYDRLYDWESEMPTENEDDSGAGVGFLFRGYSNSWPTPPYTHVTMVWVSENSFITYDGLTEYFADSGTAAEPIETHPDFIMKWSHKLWVKKALDEGVATPAFWNTATDASDAKGDIWLWSKTNPGDKWALREAEIKVGVTDWLQPTFISRETDYHSSKTNAEADLIEIGVLSDPDLDGQFGYTTGASNWLVTDVDLSFDGDYWVASIEYTHSEVGWDTDLY